MRVFVDKLIYKNFINLTVNWDQVKLVPITFLIDPPLSGDFVRIRKTSLPPVVVDSPFSISKMLFNITEGRIAMLPKNITSTTNGVNKIAIPNISRLEPTKKNISNIKKRKKLPFLKLTYSAQRKIIKKLTQDGIIPTKLSPRSSLIVKDHLGLGKEGWRYLKNSNPSRFASLTSVNLKKKIIDEMIYLSFGFQKHNENGWSIDFSKTLKLILEAKEFNNNKLNIKITVDGRQTLRWSKKSSQVLFAFSPVFLEEGFKVQSEINVYPLALVWGKEKDLHVQDLLTRILDNLPKVITIRNLEIQLFFVFVADLCSYGYYLPDYNTAASKNPCPFCDFCPGDGRKYLEYNIKDTSMTNIDIVSFCLLHCTLRASVHLYRMTIWVISSSEEIYPILLKELESFPIKWIAKTPSGEIGTSSSSPNGRSVKILRENIKKLIISVVPPTLKVLQPKKWLMQETLIKLWDTFSTVLKVAKGKISNNLEEELKFLGTFFTIIPDNLKLSPYYHMLVHINDHQKRMDDHIGNYSNQGLEKSHYRQKQIYLNSTTRGGFHQDSIKQVLVKDMRSKVIGAPNFCLIGANKPNKPKPNPRKGKKKE